MVRDLKLQRVMQHLRLCNVPFTANHSGIITTSAAVMEFKDSEVRLIRRGLAARQFCYNKLNIDRLIGMVK